jgi:hypothetical protein
VTIIRGSDWPAILCQGMEDVVMSKGVQKLPEFSGMQCQLTCNVL